MTQHTPGPCGCKTDVNEVLYYPFIVYCPLHAAAPELLEVCQGMLGYLANLPYEDRPDEKWFEPVYAAIRAATGGA